MTLSSKRLKWFLPLVLLLFLAPLTPVLDVYCANFFYNESSFSSFAPFTFAYHYAIYPAFFLAFASGCLFVLSFFYNPLKKSRLSYLFLALTMLLGPGLIINLIFKGFFVRARPLQTFLFGGHEHFKPFYHFALAFPSQFKSFPSGHASMGFYFINLIVLAKRLNNKTLFKIGLGVTAFLGLGLSLSRIAQGGHFFSDTLLSLFFQWYIALFCDWLVFEYLAKKTKLGYRKD